MPDGYSVKRLDDVPIVPGTGEPATWHPLQHHFQLRAFGANAFVAATSGIALIHEQDGMPGSSETRGSATTNG